MTSLIETVFSKPGRIDAENGVIHDVKILGRESSNGRTYSEKAVRSAARMYEGIAVNIDHPREANSTINRSFRDGFGELRNVKIKEDGVYGDLHFYKNHPDTKLFLERAERTPDKVGLSHNASGKISGSGNRVIVEDVKEVFSVDVVSHPATNKSLYESKESNMKFPTVREVLERLFPARAKDCGLLEMEGPAAAPVEYAAEAGSEDQLWAAFKSAIDSVLDDGKMDIREKLKKIGEILKAHEKLTGGGEDKKEPTETPAAESVLLKIQSEHEKLLESFSKLEVRETARGIMAEFGLSGTALLESIVAQKTPEAMRRFCREEREACGGTVVTSQLPFSRATELTYDSFIKSIKG